jgi:hypothetical protein
VRSALTTKTRDGSPIHWDLGLALFSGYDSDGFLEVQPDADGEQDAGVEAYEVHGPGGLHHRPWDPVVDPNTLLPDAAQSATILAAERGQMGVVLVLGDPRVLPTLPPLAKGETAIYGNAGQFSRYFADGSIAHFTTTTGGAQTGQTIVSWLTPTERDFSAPWGRETFDAFGWRVTCSNGGSVSASIMMGGSTGLAPGVDAYCTIQAATIELDGNVSIGPTGFPQFGVLQATPSVVVLTAFAAAVTSLTAAVTALAAAVAGFTGSGTFPALPTVQQALSVVTTAIGAVSTQIAAMPTTCATITGIG